MKFRSLKYLLLIIPVLLLSCKTQSYLIKVYTPPMLELPLEVKGILVFNRFVPASGDYDRVKWGAYDSLDTTMLEVSDSCVSAFNNLLNSYDRYKTRMPKGERMFKHNGKDLPEPLPWEGLVKISERHFADGLAMLESFSLHESEIIISENAGTFIASVEYNMTTGWRVYQTSRRRFLDETVYRISHKISAEGKTEDEAIQNLPAHKDRMILAAQYAGEEYARRLHPGELSVKRQLYVKGHKVIEEAAAFVENGEWGKAEDKWNYNAYKAEGDELKAMCSFNMAVLSEKEGYLYKALGFARRAQKLMPSQIHLTLINELALRVFAIEEKYESGEIIKNW